ncbi:MAG: hypothetical protein PHD25_05135 [Bacteroidales bacterium]|nr:hypothetical protein [Bacteroidales bacterium]
MLLTQPPFPVRPRDENDPEDVTGPEDLPVYDHPEDRQEEGEDLQGMCRYIKDEE